MAFENVTVRLPNGQSYGPTDFATLQNWARQGRVPGGSVIIDVATGQQSPVEAFPGLTGLSAARSQTDDTVATIIPYRNAPALIAYYLGIFSLIPCLGLFLGIAAFVLGIIGIKRANQHPEAKGKVHAWIGIVVGGLCALLNVAAIVVPILAAVFSK